MGINTIINIHSYDLIKNRENHDKILCLTFSNDFRDFIKSKIDVNRQTIFVTFEEINHEDVKDWNEYVTFFLKILNEIDIVIIDTKSYSEGFKLFQSCAINSESVKEIQIWKDKDDQNNYRIISETEVNSVLSKKERTYTK